MNKITHDYRYGLCNKTSYCIDANYAKGTTFEEYLKKHRRQLVIERTVGEIGYRIRRLTPREVWRLMDFPDWAYDKTDNAGISDSQKYKQAGNSICVGVIHKIFEKLYETMPYLFDDLKVCSCFSGIGAFEMALMRLFESKEKCDNENCRDEKTNSVEPL